MKTITIKEKNYNIAERLEELNFKQFIEYYQYISSIEDVKKDFTLDVIINMFSLISNIEIETLKELTGKELPLNEMLFALEALSKDINVDNKEVPKMLEFEDKVLTIPTDLGFISWGKKLEAERLIKKEKDQLYLRTSLLALFLESQLEDTKYLPKRFETVNGIKAFLVSNFFLTNWNV